MIIKLNDFTNEAASKTKGIVLRELIENNIENIEGVDFSGISRFASPFFNNSFSALALIYGFEKIGSIELIGINEVGCETYETSMENAKLLSQNEQYMDAINDIVNSVPKKAGD